jgi:hypothetical protein
MAASSRPLPRLGRSRIFFLLVLVRFGGPAEFLSRGLSTFKTGLDPLNDQIPFHLSEG